MLCALIALFLASCSSPVAVNAPPVSQSQCDYTIAPGASIQNAIDSNPSGTKFCMPAGTWQGQTFTPKNDDQFLGDSAGGTLLDGTGTDGMLTDGWDNSVTGVVFDSLTVNGYEADHLGNPDCEPGGGQAQIQTGNGWIIRNSTFQNSGCTGVFVLGGITFTNNRATNNQKLGVFCYVNLPGAVGNMLFQGNEFDANNQGHYTQDDTPAGIKCYADQNNNAQTVTIENNYVHDNVAAGVWLDTNINGAIVQGNTIVNNAVTGLQYEVSSGPCDISHNVIYGNGVGPFYPNNPVNYGGTGIYISTSGGCNIHDNNVSSPAGSWGPIYMQCDSRADAPSNACTNVAFYNNTVTFGSNSVNNLLYGFNNNSGVIPTGSYSDNNQFYDTVDTSQQHWLWNTAPYVANTFTEYTTLTGQDAHSTLTVGNASVPGCTTIGCTGSGW
jgi:hypothetical protein